jgi:hypothetical protein
VVVAPVAATAVVADACASAATGDNIDGTIKDSRTNIQRNLKDITAPKNPKKSAS